MVYLASVLVGGCCDFEFRLLTAFQVAQSSEVGLFFLFSGLCTRLAERFR